MKNREEILQVRDLRVAYDTCEANTVYTHFALRGICFGLRRSEILGALGESGSGKSTLASSLLRLLPRNGRITGGSVFFENGNLFSADANTLREIRGSRIAMIFQEPNIALHPTMQAGEQIAEVLRAHRKLTKRERRAKAMETLALLFSSDVERIFSSYPHELSGGQRQRILIAQAIACEPSIVIADEPTASLDPVAQREIFSLFLQLREQLGFSLLFITHQPTLLNGFADRILVLYGGSVVEIGLATTVLSSPRHPYTAALLACLPKSNSEDVEKGYKQPLAVIPGEMGAELPTKGCCFAPRCPEKMEICEMREPLAVRVDQDSEVACWKFADCIAEET